ncbi:hypothetical protein [Clostridium formicaceticum]|nr:hypothetical protein [Clostridium formicaceticum]
MPLIFGSGSLIMGKDDIYELHKAPPNAKIIASHWNFSNAVINRT